MTCAVSATTVIGGISAAASVASAGYSIMSGMQGNASGAGQTAWANQMNMQIAQRNAQLARDRAAADSEDIAANTRRALGTVRANAGASGLLVEEGSPLETTIATAGAGELTRQRRLWEGEVDAQESLIGGVSQQRTFTPSYAGIAQGGAQLLNGMSRVKDLLDSKPSGAKKSYDSIDQLISREGI